MSSSPPNARSTPSYIARDDERQQERANALAEAEGTLAFLKKAHHVPEGQTPEGWFRSVLAIAAVEFERLLTLTRSDQ